MFQPTRKTWKSRSLPKTCLKKAQFPQSFHEPRNLFQFFRILSAFKPFAMSIFVCTAFFSPCAQTYPSYGSLPEECNKVESTSNRGTAFKLWTQFGLHIVSRRSYVKPETILREHPFPPKESIDFGVCSASLVWHGLTCNDLCLLFWFGGFMLRLVVWMECFVFENGYDGFERGQCVLAWLVWLTLKPLI